MAREHTPPQKGESWSAPATSRCVLRLVAHLDWRTARVADVGAGHGHFSMLLAEMLRSKGIDPSAHVFPCDLIPASWQYDTMPCARIEPDGRLPFADNEFDAVLSMEVIEHVENQFAFMRELARIAKPGGLVIVTTPNTLNINSRLRTLLAGFPLLFDPLPLAYNDPRALHGHIHPIGPYFLAYVALRAGLREPTFHPDRTKKSAVSLTLLFAPCLLIGRFFHHRRLRRKEPEVLRENQALLAMQECWGLLTCRSAVLRAIKPAVESHA